MRYYHILIYIIIIILVYIIYLLTLPSYDVVVFGSTNITKRISHNFAALGKRVGYIDNDMYKRLYKQSYPHDDDYTWIDIENVPMSYVPIMRTIDNKMISIEKIHGYEPSYYWNGLLFIATGSIDNEPIIKKVRSKLVVCTNCKPVTCQKVYINNDYYSLNPPHALRGEYFGGGTIYYIHPFHFTLDNITIDAYEISIRTAALTIENVDFY